MSASRRATVSGLRVEMGSVMANSGRYRCRGSRRPGARRAVCVRASCRVLYSALRVVPSRSASTSIGTSSTSSASTTRRWCGVSAVAIAASTARASWAASVTSDGVGESSRMTNVSGNVTSRWRQACRRTSDPGLQDAELVGPGGEPAASLEGRQLTEHRDQRFVGGLLGQVLQLAGAGAGKQVAQPPDLVAGRTQQHLVQSCAAPRHRPYPASVRSADPCLARRG